MKIRPCAPLGASFIVAASCALRAGQTIEARDPTTTTNDVVYLDPPSSPSPGGEPNDNLPWWTVVGRITRPQASQIHAFTSSWPGTSFGVRFVGTGLRVSLLDTNQQPIADPIGGWQGQANLWDITIDGALQANALVAQRTLTDTVVAEGLPAGPHEIWLTRRNEAIHTGRGEVVGLTVEGGTLSPPPPARTRRIEVIGTSVETGFFAGLTANDPTVQQQPSCVRTSFNCNQNRAWPKLVAEALGAELMNTSVEGAGLLIGITNYAGPGVQIPQYYPRADLFAESPPWDANDFVADVVLVVAGWSDLSQINVSSFFSSPALANAYAAFLAQVRQQQPTALIYAVARCPDNQPQQYAMVRLINDAVEQQADAGDAHVKMMELPAWSSGAANCAFHPSWSQHQDLANAAVAIIRTDTGWQ